MHKRDRHPNVVGECGFVVLVGVMMITGDCCDDDESSVKAAKAMLYSTLSHFYIISNSINHVTNLIHVM